ncbi:Inositol-1-monophosphatase [Gryllus bimaculatus]|nr:Inositol-1-monophosphatase [Gryllus bimaculatus]
MRYIGEESVADGQLIELTDNPTWIIDPIDGTMNFIHGYPNFCISIGLWIKKKPYIGIVYNPILELMFTAQIGKGAFLNGNCISTSSVTELDKALMLTEFGNTRTPESMSMVMENLRRLLPLTHGVRVCGASALNIAMVAMGGADVFYQAGLYIWDLAAGVLLVQEAGGFVSDPAVEKMDEEAQQRFEAELCWCIQKLESSLNSGKLKKKQVEDATKTLKTLQSSKAPLVKKRQVMSVQFGNYRSKMEEEDKKIKKALKDVKLKEIAPSKKSSFLRKSSKISGEAPNIDECNEMKNSDFKFTPSDNNFKFQFDET